MNLTVGKVYAVFSKEGATATLRNGAVLEFPAGQPVTLVAQQATLELDGHAVVRELPNGNAVLLGEMMKRQSGLPAGYTQVDYLIFPAGNKSIIRTNESFNNSSSLVLSISIPGQNNYTGWLIFDEERFENKSSWSLFFDEASRKIYYEQQNPTRYSYYDPMILSSDKHYEIDVDAYSVAVNGDRKPMFDDSDLKCTHRITNYSEKLDVYYYSVIQKDDTGMQMKLIPALDSTGAPCMFDLVSRKPFYNSGEGDFLYPGQETEISTFSLRRPVTYAQLTEHGVRRLYHVPRGYNGTKEEYAMEHGFKPLVETPQPEAGYWVPEWRETEEEIVLEWVETEPPAKENDEILTNN